MYFINFISNLKDFPYFSTIVLNLLCTDCTTTICIRDLQYWGKTRTLSLTKASVVILVVCD